MNCNKEAYDLENNKPIYYNGSVLEPSVDSLYKFCQFPGSDLYSKVFSLF